MVWPEAGVNKLPEEGIMEQRNSEGLVVLELVVAMDADGLEVASKGTQEHDEPGHHGGARVVRSQDDNTPLPRKVCHVEMAAIQPLQEVGLIKLGWGIILALQ